MRGAGKAHIWRVHSIQLAAIALMLSSRCAAQAHWTATWGTSNVHQSGNQTLSNQTLRQVIHTSIGGKAIRVVFSNRFGSQTLRLDDVQVSLRESGSAISPGSTRQLHRKGSSEIVIEPGGEVITDPLDFQVEPLSDIVISFHLPQLTPLTTVHPSAHQTNYIASGDVSKEPRFPENSVTKSYFFMSSLLVDDPKSLGAIVTLGASITDGSVSTDDTNSRWPNLLAQRLQNAGLQFAVVNAGISGNRLLRDGAGESATHRFNHDVLEQIDVRWVIFSDDPINDLGGNPSPTAEELITAVRELIDDTHEHGIRFGCSTLTPYEGAGYWKPGAEIERAKYNAFIRSAASGCDLVMDQDMATRDPEHLQRFLPSYDHGDHLHPNDAGMHAIADCLDLKSLASGHSTSNR